MHMVFHKILSLPCGLSMLLLNAKAFSGPSANCKLSSSLAVKNCYMCLVLQEAVYNYEFQFNVII